MSDQKAIEKAYGESYEKAKSGKGSDIFDAAESLGKSLLFGDDEIDKAKEQGYLDGKAGKKKEWKK